MRKIYLIGSIDEDMYKSFTQELDELLEVGEDKIEVELCSGGGDDEIAFAMHGKIVNCKASIEMTAYGQVQSAAVLLLAAADYRKADSQTLFMVHESEAELKGETKDLLKQIKRMEIDERRFYKLLEKHSELDYESWRKLARKTTYFDAMSALRFKLIDEVIGAVDDIDVV